MISNSQQSITLSTLTQAFGFSIADRHFQHCLQQTQYLSPNVGKFWLGSEAPSGLYLVLVGKVRLLNASEELIATVEAGQTFGEFTLFSDANFVPYDARASLNLQLAFLPKSVIYSLFQEYTQIKEQLWQQAQERNTLLMKSAELSPNAIADESFPGWSMPPSEPSSQRRINKAYFPTPATQIGHWLQRIIRRYPFFAQQSGSDCGATCLVMVARYWGKRFSINRVRDIANVDRNGASLRGLAAAAESVGFSTRPVKASLDQLAKQTLPAIAH